MIFNSFYFTAKNECSSKRLLRNFLLLLVKAKYFFFTGTFTAEVNSVDENALPLDTFVQLPGEKSQVLFIRTAKVW
jgi:hypothetical protein